MDLSPAFEGLDDKERVYVQSRLAGMSQIASAAAAGLPRQNTERYEKKGSIAAALAKGREISIQQTGITREKVSEMLMDAYRSAATATEMVMAARELGRLHGVYAPQKVDVEVEHRLKHVKTEQDLKRLKTADLLKLAATRGDDILEAEFAEVLPVPRIGHSVQEAD